MVLGFSQVHVSILWGGTSGCTSGMCSAKSN